MVWMVQVCKRSKMILVNEKCIAFGLKKKDIVFG
jgi:hypothetical protein